MVEWGYRICSMFGSKKHIVPLEFQDEPTDRLCSPVPVLEEVRRVITCCGPLFLKRISHHARLTINRGR